ncbi:MAG TPA: hypothetical protein VLF18_11830 [Tahibacter sp.]|uniref:hypothetical protein n=1 Tax=Tahibacter sp. TaxID=2056211 RepID=UPI002C4A502F|nr:hypothetical protein [Tahibacter sp.]HSX60881.1 hypothetical protein [Tahibacter sp.]
MTNRSPSRAVSREFRNDTAAVVWIMVAVWIAMLACFSYVAWRDGGIPQVGRWAWPLLGLFWLCGVGAAAWAAGMPLVRIELSAEGLRVRERYPLRVDERRYLARDLSSPRIEATRDSDGDERFDAVLDLPGNRRVVVLESSDRASVERRCDELLASLRTVCRGFSG